MLKFSKTDRRDKSTSSLESCAAVENRRQIIYRKVSQQETSPYGGSIVSDNEDTASIGASSFGVSSSIGTSSSIETNASDDIRTTSVSRTHSFSRELDESERTMSSNMMRYSPSDDKITRHAYSPMSDNFTARRPTPSRSHGSISEESIDGLDNIDFNYNNNYNNNDIILSDIVLKKKKNENYYTPSRDVYIVGKIPRYRTSLSFNEEYIGGGGGSTDFNYGDLRFRTPSRNVKSEGKHLTSIDVNENFASPMTTTIIRNSPPPMRRRFITQPTTEYEHTPPEQLRNRSRDILRPAVFTPEQTTSNNQNSRMATESSQNTVKSSNSKSDRKANVKKISSEDSSSGRRRTSSDVCQKSPENSGSGAFRRFCEMRQQVKKMVKSSEKSSSKKSSSSLSKKSSRSESINESCGERWMVASNSDRIASSPDSVFNSPVSVNRSLTQSDCSFSANSDTQDVTNRLNNIQYGKYRKNDLCQFDFDSRDTLTRKPSPLSSTDSQYYGSGSSLSSSNFGQHHHQSTDISALTSDMLVSIFTYLNTRDICRISRVCRRWYDVYLSTELWERISITNSNDLEIDDVMNLLLQRLAFKTCQGCMCIKNIQLDGCVKLTDEGIKTICRRCPELRSLEIASCFQVTGRGLYDVLTNCPNLVYLNVSHSEGILDFSSTLSEVSLKLLDNTTFGDMRYVDLSGCTSLTDDGLRDLLKCTTMLEFLYLRQCDSISNVGLRCIATYCQNLKELSLNDCYNITDAGVEKIVQSCSNLRYLSVAKCPISDAAVTSIATFGLQLRHLNLYECDFITDVGVMNIANSCPRMRSLDVGKCSNVTDASLYALSRCTKIRRLDLKGCTKVTDAGLRKLATHCFNLRHLDVRQCFFSSETFLYIKRHCAFCDILHDDTDYC